MKVAVIGRGSGGLITAMNLLTFNIDVDVYYDPKTSQLPVGESTTPQFASLIECTLGLTIDDLISLGLASRKKGIEFVDWGNSKHFYHRFLHADAIHFYTKTLNPFLQENLEKYCKVKFIGKRVTALQALQNAYDFVINCSGALNNHRKEIDIPCVNSVLYFDDHKINHEYHFGITHEWGILLNNLIKYNSLNNQSNNTSRFLQNLQCWILHTMVYYDNILSSYANHL